MDPTSKKAFDVYCKKSRPSVRLATRPGAKLPPQFLVKDWVLISERESPTVHSDARMDIAVKGYCYFEVIKG
jgi:hypothetical protein